MWTDRPVLSDRQHIFSPQCLGDNDLAVGIAAVDLKTCLARSTASVVTDGKSTDNLLMWMALVVVLASNTPWRFVQAQTSLAESNQQSAVHNITVI
jgi:hypothetical protein